MWYYYSLEMIYAWNISISKNNYTKYAGGYNFGVGAWVGIHIPHMEIDVISRRVLVSI